MKLYEETMEALRFSGDFCEKTLEQIETCPPRTQRRVPRVLAAAACVILGVSLLFGTAWAVSPEFRALFLQNERVTTVEQVALPREPGTVTVTDLGPITARYYTLDGRYANYDGAHGFIPVEKGGKTTIYRIDETGALVAALPTRHVKQAVDYGGQHWDVELDIYEAEPPIALGLTPEGYACCLRDRDTLTLWLETDQWHQPIRLDLNTGTVTDPFANLAFTPPEGLMSDFGPGAVGLSVEPGGTVALIDCHMADQSYRYYRADLVTGAVTELGGEPYTGTAVFTQSVRLYHDRIYSNAGDRLAVWTEDGNWQPLIGENERSNYDHGRYAIVEDRAQKQLSLLDLDTGDRLLFSDVDGALDFSSSIVYSPSGARFALTRFSLTPGSLSTKTLAVVNPETLRMVTLERQPGMAEGQAGWLDDTHFLIAGTDSICVYSID